MRSDSEILQDIFDYFWVIDGRVHLERGLMSDELEKEVQARRTQMCEEKVLKQPTTGSLKQQCKKILDKEQLILAAMSPVDGESFSSTQILNLIFLIDRNVSDEIGSYFNFKPEAYGPFDSDVFEVITTLSKRGLVHIGLEPNGNLTYQLSVKGQRAGEEYLSKLSAKVMDYIKRLSVFIRGMSFRELVTKVCREYPEMKVNSVFKEQV